MGKSKKNEGFDPHNLSAQDQLKFEIAQELGLDAKVMEGGWRSLTAKESGKIGGLITKRKRELKKGYRNREQRICAAALLEAGMGGGWNPASGQVSFGMDRIHV